MARTTQPGRPLDATDRNLIALLRRDCKRTLADLGAEVALSAAAVKRRVDRLQREGIIRGYGAIVDTQATGDGLEALVEIYCSDSTAPADVRASGDLPEVVSAFTVSGEPDALVRVRVESIRHLETIIERLRRDRNIVRTRTLIVLSTLLDRP